MRTLNIEELETIGGGADDSNSAGLCCTKI